MGYAEELRAKQQIFAFNIANLIHYAHFIGVRLTFGEAHRTEDQQFLYVNGKTISGGQLVSAPVRSWTTDSMHLKRLAVDFNFFVDEKDGDYDGMYELDYMHPKVRQLGNYWESLHPLNRWGGNWTSKDWPHFEMKF